ncbi:pilus assembly protein PilM [Romboutsia sedimentorum]|uniref:pilus assembly protein PilM n=1 Tax=Romboutsia sedimentorum TaxID=1368474 RepID=UPI0024DEA480|nr:pilus assembly protein PilM [Romboutsia sedimentorum]MDK2585944.1 pilus assembly protein PilM [Romboutsia sedimentorum]
MNNNQIKITLLRKSKNEITIFKSSEKTIPNKYILENNINIQSDYISHVIKQEVRGVEKSYKNIVYNIQDDKTIIINIETLNIKNKKDLLKIIKCEIKQYTPINIDDYRIKYKIINSNKNKLNLQVILIEKVTINLCNQISKKLKSKPRILNVNCDILQKLLSLNLIQDFSKEGVFIECKDRDFIINIVKENKIYESHILPRTIQSYESVVNSIKDFKTIYYYGKNDPFIKSYLSDDFKIRPLEIDDNIKLIKNKKLLRDKSINYINSIGMII